MSKQKPNPIVSRRVTKRARGGPSAPAPKVTHGTQVRFNIVCPRCGEDDTLPFVPKTQGDVLCRRCAEEVFGPDWAHGRELAEEPTSYTFQCVKCGRKDRIHFKPHDDHDLLCKACLRGEEQPRLDRLKRMKKVE